MPSFTSWTNAGAGVAVTQESTIVRHGTYSAKIVAGGGAAGQMTQTPTVNVKGHAPVYFDAWVYCTAASTGRIGVDYGGGNAVAYSSYHTGESDWEYLTYSGTVPSTATQVKFILEAAAAGTAYFDAVWGSAGAVYKYTLPTSFARRPQQVLYQMYEDSPNGMYRPFSQGSAPPMGRRLRILGEGLLSQPSTDSGTYEVGDPQLELLIAYAMPWLYRAVAQGGNQQERAYLSGLKKDWENDIAQLLTKPGMKMSRLAAQIPTDSWRMEEDSSGRYLVLTAFRGDAIA